MAKNRSKIGQIWAGNISTTNIQIFLEFLGQYKNPLISLTEVLFFRCLLSTRQNIEKTQYFETQYSDLSHIRQTVEGYPMAFFRIRIGIMVAVY